MELLCPACGALIEAEDIDLLIEAASQHTLRAHQYAVPAEHIRHAAQPA
jgi:hypothetical protein